MPSPRRDGILQRFARDRRAVAVVEFALVLPVILVMYLGMVEITRAVSNSRKVTLLARTLSDLTARGAVPSMADIFAASAAVLAPFKSSDAKMVVSAIGVYGSGAGVQGRVCSSQASGGATALAVNSVVPVPTGFETKGARFIRADVDMDYTPMLGSAILQWVTGGRSSIQFGEKTPWPVRNGTTYNSEYQEIVLPGGQPCPK
jgi:Flp pilus assembly protein TadG